MITRTFKLCLNAGTGSAPFINVSQTDRDETWLFELYTETGERYIPSSGAIIGIKADGHGIANTGTVDSEGRVVITETEQMTAAAGRSIFELSIDGLTHGTANFIVNVEKKPIDGAIMSDSDLSLISEAVDSAAVIVEVIGDSDPSEVIGEHVDDWLDNHPEATTTVLDGAITAPKLNNSLWDKLLVSEEASGTIASFIDGADDVPVKSLKVSLEPIQLGSGDPSPSNIRPIISANGKNLLPNNLTFTSGTRGDDGSHSSSYLSHYSEKISINPSTEYTLQVPKVEGISIRVYYLTSTEGWISRTAGVTAGYMTFTTPSNCYYIQIQCAADVTLAENAQLEYGNSPTAIQPYQGIMVERCGINQWDEQWEVGYYGSTGQPNNTSGYIRSKNFIPVMPNATYYCHTGTASTFCLQFYGKDTAFLSQDYNHRDTTVTIPNDCYYVRFWRNENAYNNDISINYPSTITDYHAYIGTSYPYTLGQPVYGGTVDLATGVLTVDRAMVDMGSLVWNDGNFSNFTSPSIQSTIAQTSSSVLPKLLAENLKTIMYDNRNASTDARISISPGKTLDVRGTSYENAAAFKTAVNGVKLVYELATPTTVQLTPQEVKTLLGYNNISSSGTVDVIYHADTKLYVDKMTAVDNNIIAPTEADFVATRNYTVNDIVIVNDTLYKVTANIATGSAITPNSNVTQTTLSALIKALS